MQVLFFIKACVLIFISMDVKSQNNSGHQNITELCFKDTSITFEDAKTKVKIQNLISSLDSLKQKHNFEMDLEYSIVYYYTERTALNDDSKCFWMNFAFDIAEYLYEQYEINANLFFSNKKSFGVKVDESHICLSPLWK